METTILLLDGAVFLFMEALGSLKGNEYYFDPLLPDGAPLSDYYKIV